MKRTRGWLDTDDVHDQGVTIQKYSSRGDGIVGRRGEAGGRQHEGGIEREGLRATMEGGGGGGVAGGRHVD